MGDAQPRGRAKADEQIDPQRRIGHGEHQHEPADGNNPARLHLGRQLADNGHLKEQDEAAGGERESRRLGRVAHQRLEKLWHQHHTGEQHDPQHEHHEVGRQKAEIAEEAHFDDRSGVKPLPDHEDSEAHEGHDREGRNEVGSEPIVLLTSVQHHLQGADAQHEQAHAHVVQSNTGPPSPEEVGRILDELQNQQEREEAHREVDKKDPAPGIVVGNEAAQRRSDRGSHDRGQPVEREGEAPLLRREHVGKDGLRHWLEPAATGPLDDARDDEAPEGRSQPAEQRTHGEEDEARREEPLATEGAGEPATDRQHDGVGNEIGREHPGALIVAGPEITRHVRQGHVGNAGVEDLHEGGQGHDDRDQPRVVARTPGGFPAGSGE